MNSETTNLVEDLTRKKLERASARRPITRAQLREAMRQTIQRMEAQRILGEHPFSYSRALRGMLAMKGEVLDDRTAETDVEYARALSSGSTPGSYLVPVISADAIVSQLQQYAVARAAGARIWPMAGMLQLDIPVGISAPSVVWVAQNSRQTPTDPNLGQITFALKQQTALELIPLQLLRTSKPVFDVILSDSFALACAESEDSAMFASATQAGAPGALLAASGITLVNVGGSANGGNLAYSDILAVMLKAAQLKLRPPLCWFCSPRTLYSRLLSLSDTASRPLLIPDVSDPATSGYSLMGYPLYVTTSISETEALGSGTNQSHLILTTPRSIHIGEDHDVTMQVALDGQYFDAAQAGLRIGRQLDFAYQPAAGLVCLVGIN
jgi:HK97 family phage major capsid protein